MATSLARDAKIDDWTDSARRNIQRLNRRLPALTGCGRSLVWRSSACSLRSSSTTIRFGPIIARQLARALVTAARDGTVMTYDDRTVDHPNSRRNARACAQRSLHVKNSKAFVAMVAIALVIAIGAIAGRTVEAAGPPTIILGTAANFSILAGTPSVSNTGPTTTDRSVGIHPAASVIGFAGLRTAPSGGTIEAGQRRSHCGKGRSGHRVWRRGGRTGHRESYALGGLTLVGGVYNSGARRWISREPSRSTRSSTRAPSGSSRRHPTS